MNNSKKRKSILAIKSSCLRRTILIIGFIPILTICYLYYIIKVIIEVTKELFSAFKLAWKGQNKEGDK